MDCKHKNLCCRDNVFLCLDCGAEVPDPFKVIEDTPAEENAPEAAEKPAEGHTEEPEVKPDEPAEKPKKTRRKKGETV